MCKYRYILFYGAHIVFYTILYYDSTISNILSSVCEFLENATCHARMYYNSHWCYAENMPNS